MSAQLDEIADRLQVLADQEEIRRVLYTYFRAVDAADWDLMASCYHDDATDEHAGVYTGGIDGLVRWCVENVAREFSSWMHLGGQSIIDVDGDTAQTETYAVAIHKTHPDASGSTHDVIAAGRFFDRFEKRDGAWRIAQRRLVIDWIPSAPVSDDAHLLSGAGS